MMDRPIDAGLPKRKRAAEWLRQYLLEGERSQYTVEFAAQQDGVCIDNLAPRQVRSGRRELQGNLHRRLVLGLAGKRISWLTQWSPK